MRYRRLQTKFDRLIFNRQDGKKEGVIMMKHFTFFRVSKTLLFLIFSIFISGTYMPQQSYAQPIASEESALFARELSNTCLKQWEAPGCLSNISQSTLVLAANFAGDLESSGMVGAVEQVKQSCAAATAATQGNYPAYAMRSAFTQCANSIADISEQTRINPDQSHYQLLVSSILCLSKDRRCAMIEKGLKAYKK